MTPVHSVLALWAGVSSIQGRSPAQDSVVRIWDSVSGRFVDSVVVRSPLPDPLIPIVQWIFQKPSWVMIGGIVLATVVGAVVLRMLWVRRKAIRTWLVTRDRGVKLALGGAAAAVLLLIVAGGLKATNYMMHDNDFCRGCHIFVPSGQLFVKPDTGHYLLVNQLEGKHDTLSCHACHPFELKAQTKELFYWIVDRPEKIPPHAKVPRTVCEQCHVQGDAKKTWQRVASTAGHRIHLESDSAPLKKVQCLTCHARTAHRFQPADTTCAQKGCHLTDDVKIRLGRMATRFQEGRALPNEEQLYCNSCHQFTAEAQLVSRDSAGKTLQPRERQCFGCHEMRALLATFDPARDPHRGSCGMCHNPHTDVKPKDALKSCAEAGCHANWRTVPFHVGAAHRKVAGRCETCHQPHAARVDASDCTGCHTEIQKGGGRKRPPLPFDTTKALQQSVRPLVEPGRSRGQGDAPPEAPADTFSHQRHRKLACITCHSTTSQRSKLTFQPPRGCQVCHHQRPSRADCASCHTGDELEPAEAVTFQVSVPKHAARSRQAEFAHAEHTTMTCIQCHTTPVTLDAAPAVKQCRDCHGDHHTARRDCAVCHRTSEIKTAHAPPVAAHERCDECHSGKTVEALTPDRGFCLTCHGGTE
ncbi:MAG TPA: cytochrome c3 family protein, partial [Gemmatimonadales bacterium]